MPSLSISDREYLVQNSMSQVAVSTANADVVVTFPAAIGVKHALVACMVSYSAAPSGGRLTVTDGTTVEYDVDLTANGAINIPLPPGGVVGTPGNAMIVKLFAGGGSAVGKLNTCRISQ